MKLTIEEMKQKVPKFDQSAIEKQVMEELLFDQQALFWRKEETCDETGLFLDFKPEKIYECYCTACRHPFALPRGAKENHPKDLTHCPECGAPVSAHIWRENRKPQSLEFRFLLYIPLIGEDGEVWFRVFRMVWRYGKPEWERLDFLWECGRLRFYAGGAQRWNSSWGNWKEQISVKEFSWVRCYSYEKYPDAILGFPDLTDTVLSYSHLPLALKIAKNSGNFSWIKYLELYCKWPTGTERLIKMGLGHWICRKLNGDGSMFRSLVRMQTKDPKKFFALSRAEIRHCTVHQISLSNAYVYKQMKSKGFVRNEPDDWELAQALSFIAGSFVDWEKSIELPMRDVIGYLKKQKRKTGIQYRELLIDYQDYLRQLKELQPARDTLPEYYPPDLQIAHERLSARLRKVAQRKNISAFRQRRRQLTYTRMSWHRMQMRPIDSPMELVKEGELQRNCVAGYEGRHIRGETAILVLRQTENAKRPWYTVEFDEKTNEIIQCRAYQNRAGTEEEQAMKDAFLKKWLAKVKERHPTKTKRRAV